MYCALEERVPAQHRDVCLAGVKAAEERAAKARDPVRKAAASRRAKRGKEPAHIQWRRALLARKSQCAAPKRKLIDEYQRNVAKDIAKCKRTFLPDAKEWSAAKRRRTPKEDLEEIESSHNAAQATRGSILTT